MALSIMQEYQMRTNGSVVETKESSVTWRYMNADPEYGIMMAKELQAHLLSFLKHFDVDVVMGKQYVEVRPFGASRSSSSERCQPPSGLRSRSPGHAYDAASGYSIIHSGANFWCSVLGVTTWPTGPSSASAARSDVSRPTGEWTHSLPSGKRTTTALHATSVLVSPGSLG